MSSFLGGGGTGGGGTSLVVNSTTIIGGAPNQILFDNSGVLGEYTQSQVSFYVGGRVDVSGQKFYIRTVPVPGTITGANPGVVTSATHGLAKGDAVAFSIIRTHVPVTSISNASPAVVTLAGHGLAVNDPIAFINTGNGVLNTGITPNTTYYVIAAGFTTGQFEFSATVGGAAINTTSAGTGTQAFYRSGNLPGPNIVEGQVYYVANDGNYSTNTFAFSDTLAHALAGTGQIDCSGAPTQNGYFVWSTGKDPPVNDGLSQAYGHAWLTIQGVANYLSDYTFTNSLTEINLADGTYFESVGFGATSGGETVPLSGPIPPFTGDGYSIFGNSGIVENVRWRPATFYPAATICDGLWEFGWITFEDPASLTDLLLVIGPGDAGFEYCDYGSAQGGNYLTCTGDTSSSGFAIVTGATRIVGPGGGFEANKFGYLEISHNPNFSFCVDPTSAYFMSAQRGGHFYVNPVDAVFDNSAVVTSGGQFLVNTLGRFIISNGHISDLPGNPAISVITDGFLSDLSGQHTGAISFRTGTGATHDVTVQAQSGTGTWTMQLPTSAGTNTYLLQTDGTGVTSWVAPPSGTTAANPTAIASNVAVNGVATTFMRSDAAPAVQLTSASVFGLCKVDGTTITAAGGVITAIGGGGGTPGSPSGSIQYNNSGVFGGMSNFSNNAGNPSVSDGNSYQYGGLIWIQGSNSNDNCFFGKQCGNSANLTGASFNTGVGYVTLNAITSGGGNTAIGAGCLTGTTTGHENTAVGGFAALACTIGTQNTALGYQALGNATGDSLNVAVGWHALITQNGGAQNTVVGALAAAFLTTAINDTVVGFGAGGHITTGSANCLIGTSAGAALTTESSVTCVGHQAGQSAVGLQTGDALFGYQAGANITSSGGNNLGVGTNAFSQLAGGTGNVALGAGALAGVLGGSNNMGIGSASLTACTSGQANVGVGQNTLTSITSGQANVAIGQNAGRSLLGNDSILIGTAAGIDITTGGGNCIVGGLAGVNSGITSGQGNTVLGVGMGTLLSNPSGVVIIGSGYPSAVIRADFGLTVANAWTLTASAGVYTTSATFMLRNNVGLTGGSTANAPTLTAGPVTGNPTKWLPYDDNGVTRYIPSW